MSRTEPGRSDGPGTVGPSGGGSGQDAVRGVAFPRQADGRRGTTAVGRAVVADALRPVDLPGARAVERETAWRSGYPTHFCRLVEAGLTSPEDWRAIATAGLDAVHGRLRFVGTDGLDAPLEVAAATPPGPGLRTLDVRGDGSPADFALPYRGRLLRGDDVRRRVADWVAAGVVEPSVAPVVDAVLAHPDWLRLDGRTVAVLGAGAEMGPLPALLRWGATVAAVDLPGAPTWDRVLQAAGSGAGRLLVPLPAVGEVSGAAGAEPARVAGADVLTGAGAIADWLAALDGDLVLGSYVYGDGGLHVRLSAAVDALTVRLLRDRPGTALAFLATPTDVFAVPGDAVEQSTRAYEGRSTAAKLLGRPARLLSRGRVLQRAYVPGSDPGLCDSLVPVQGPNYALAKKIQRWRATVARASGTSVSFHVAPSTRTRSVVRNRTLAAAYAGAHRFGVEVFEPATASTLMAAMLVHDLHQPSPEHAHPWQDEAHAAAHGGLWRMPYAPRSALGLAAVLGYASSRG